MSLPPTASNEANLQKQLESRAETNKQLAELNKTLALMLEELKSMTTVLRGLTGGVALIEPALQRLTK